MHARATRWLATALVLGCCLTGLFLAGVFKMRVALAQDGSAITSPVPGSTLGGVVPITGTAQIDNFDRYELHYKAEPSGDESYIYLSGGTAQVADGLLGTWNTAEVPEGAYTLRMRVVKTDGNYTEIFVPDLQVDQSPPPTPTATPTATVPPTATNTPVAAAAPPTATATPTATAAAAIEETTTETTDEGATTAPPGGAVAETVTVSAAAPLGFPQPVTVTVAGGDEAGLRSLLRHLFASFGGGSTETITVVVGNLPPELPFQLSLPESASVVGGVVRRGEFGGTQIFLSTEEAAADLVEVISLQLQEQDFTEPPESVLGRPNQVFLSAQDEQPALFCGPDADLFVQVIPLLLVDAAAAVRLDLNPIQGDGSPCAGSAQEQPLGLQVLPRLVPPEQTQVRGSGSTRSGNGVSAEAELRSPLSALELAAHYEAQLEAAGWERLDQSAVDAIAWSAWTFAGEDANAWDATFYIVRHGGAANAYTATLRAERQP